MRSPIKIMRLLWLHYVKSKIKESASIFTFYYSDLNAE